MRHLAALALLIVPAPLCAHEMWLAPDTYRATGAAAETHVRFLVGDAADITPWRLVWERVVSLRTVAPDGRARDEQERIVATGNGQDGGATLALSGTGTHVIAFESNKSENVLPAKEFEAYLEQEGLTLVSSARRASGMSQKDGREVYSRRAKALVQLGARPTPNVLQPIGMTLEIVPMINPYGLKAGAMLPAQVRFRGEPLPGAKVLLADLDHPLAPPASAITDARGVVGFTAADKGRWRLSVVWSEPISGNPRAEFDTIFSSLTFGY